MKTLLYGAYGYTGERIAREASERGLDLVVAGRNGTTVSYTHLTLPTIYSV